MQTLHTWPPQSSAVFEYGCRCHMSAVSDEIKIPQIIDSLDQVWSILPAVELLPLKAQAKGRTDSNSWGGATPMQAKWSKLDLQSPLGLFCIAVYFAKNRLPCPEWFADVQYTVAHPTQTLNFSQDHFTALTKRISILSTFNYWFRIPPNDLLRFWITMGIYENSQITPFHLVAGEKTPCMVSLCRNSGSKNTLKINKWLSPW